MQDYRTSNKLKVFDPKTTWIWELLVMLFWTDVRLNDVKSALRNEIEAMPAYCPVWAELTPLPARALVALQSKWDFCRRWNLTIYMNTYRWMNAKQPDVWALFTPNSSCVNASRLLPVNAPGTYWEHCRSRVSPPFPRLGAARESVRLQERALKASSQPRSFWGADSQELSSPQVLKRTLPAHPGSPRAQTARGAPGVWIKN